MSKKIENWTQCRFVQEGTGEARMETVAYIDATQAKVGARVSLKGVDGIWRIESTGQPGLRPHHGWGGMD